MHRFTEEGSVQVLWVSRAEDTLKVRDIAKQYLEGSLDTIEIVEGGSNTPSVLGVPAAPLALTLLFFSIVGFLLGMIGRDYIAPFTFWNAVAPMFVVDPWREIAAGEFWRLFTPAFLHFSLLHIVFNGLWLWYLGSRIELVYGRFRFLFLVIIIAVVSNTAQAIASAPTLFGGMSGVVFGLLSFVWLSGRYNSHPLLTLQRGLFPVMVGYMLLSTTGLFDFLAGGGGIGDTSHISGFFTGLLVALLFLKPFAFKDR